MCTVCGQRNADIRPDWQIAVKSFPEWRRRTDYVCGHHITVPDDADRRPDELRISDVEDKFVCIVCGQRGAEIRLGWQSAQRLNQVVVGRAADARQITHFTPTPLMFVRQASSQPRGMT